MNHADQFFGGLNTIDLMLSRVDDMLANVMLDHRADETIQSTATRRRLLQQRGASRIILQRRLHGFHLPTYAAQAVHQLAFLLIGVLHRLLTLYCVGVYGTDSRGTRIPAVLINLFFQGPHETAIDQPAFGG